MTPSPKKKIDGVRKKKEIEEIILPSQKDSFSVPPHTEISFLQTEKKTKRKRSSFRGFVLRVVFVFIFLFIALHLYDYSAKIILFPQNDLFVFDEVVPARAAPHNKVDRLPFDYISLSGEVSKEVAVSESREVEYRAEGSITLFNDYSEEPQKLIEGTRLESTGGKIFLTKEDVILPGKKGGESGRIEVLVQAERGGEEYNIDSTDFSIPFFRELGIDEKYKNIYGISSKRMEGGRIQQEPYLSEEKKELLTEDLYRELGEYLKSSLLKEKTEKVYLVDKSFLLETEEPSIRFSQEEGQALLSLSGRISGLAVGENNLKEYLIKNKFDYPEKDNIKIYFVTQPTLSLANSSEPIHMGDYKASYSIKVSTEPKVQRFIEEDLFTEISQGKKIDELYKILVENERVGAFTIKIRPFWRKKIPTDRDKIRLEVKNHQE
ncbi:MAG: hypothetical protein PHC89_02175 [Candidatus Pacebacteria bacterium]|nr:hypothetical protein [Candidatus Paceibacterota bacterium]